jgi:uncharacterized protein YndB with AHSA1/START domain
MALSEDPCGEPAEFGTLERAGELSVLRYRRRLPHARAKVWRALNEDEHLAAWFPTTIEGEHVAGAPLRFSFRAAEAAPFAGEMHVFDPPSVMELRWGDDILRFELREEGPSLTLLDLVVTFPELGKAARDGAGWHVCLDRLADAVAGSGPSWDQHERWRNVHRVYVAQLGPEASALGPPEQWERAHPPADQ